MEYCRMCSNGTKEVAHINKFCTYQTLHVCLYTSVFTLAVKEMELSGSALSYLVGVLPGRML